MLVLPIKKKWYEMILSGVKKEEYREIKDYYTTRFANIFHSVSSRNFIPFEADRKDIIFRNGYSASSPSFVANCSIRVDKGNTDWGAEKDKKYYVLTIHSIRFNGKGL